MIKRVLLGTAIVASLGAAAPVATAADIVVRVAPPAPRTEVVPAPRRGYVWVPGYWDWRGRRYAWVPGHWVRGRPGYVYSGPRWTQRGDRWVMERGHWDRGDRDHDGVPNRFDRHPDNPRRD